MLTVKSGDTVKIHYSGKLDDGTVFDSSEGQEPFQFTVGSDQIIPGLEQGIVGMAVGETQTIDVGFKDAYGPYSVEFVHEVDRTHIPPNLNLEIEQQFQMKSENDQIVVVTVIGITDQTVTLDANHPLAEHDLIFDVTVTEIVKV